MKNLIMLSTIGIFTLSSFGNIEMKFNNKTALKTWYYKCFDGRTGSFLMGSDSTQSQALAVAQHICGG